MAERKKLLLRLDPDVYDGIARWAADDIRSVNAQIEYVLRQALRSAGRHRRTSPAVADHDGPDHDGPDLDGPQQDGDDQVAP